LQAAMIRVTARNQAILTIITCGEGVRFRRSDTISEARYIRSPQFRRARLTN
jgi:hypothetical protein